MGEAFLNLALSYGSGAGGRLRSYRATGWHAQLSKITSSTRGYQAADSIGLSATPRTLRGWLAETQTPSAANRAKIAAAYDRMAGSFPEEMTRAEFRIYGDVKMGADVRDRGSGSAPLLIDGRMGNWSRIRSKWNSRPYTPDDFEDDIIDDVVAEDLGDGSEDWEFPGTGYIVRG